MGKVWCRVRFAVRTQIRESGTKMSQFGLARPGFWILNECMVNTLKVTEIRRHFWIRNNIFQCKLKPEVDNRHLSLNSIFIDDNWRKRSRRFTISFWQNGGRFGYFILLQSIFFCASKKTACRVGCCSYLGTKKKSPWTVLNVSLCNFRKREWGLGGEGGGAISPFPRKTTTTTTATTLDDIIINNINNKDQKNYQNSPLRLRRKICLRIPASSCPKRKELERRRTKILLTWIYKMSTGSF